MGQKPKVFKKNIVDFDNTACQITVSDDEATNAGENFVDQLRDRKNITGWGTTGSSDTATTILEADWVDALTVDEIILVGHNFKDFKIERWNGSAWEDFDTPISVTGSTDFVSNFELPKQNISRIRITITATQIADADKSMRQLIVAEKVGAGQFEGWPEIRKFQRSQLRKASTTLSGKSYLREQLGGNEYQLAFRVWPYDSDFKMIESIFFENNRGVLFWPSGGDSAQFKYERRGYKLEDIFLMKPSSEFSPVFEKGIYKNGVNMILNLVEVI